MSRHLPLPVLLPAAALALVLAPALPASQTQPNVVIFLVDDLGWTDIQHNAALFPQGSLYYETPNLDSLAQASVVFHHAYAEPLCSPTRSSMMSGQYPCRFSVTTAIVTSSVDDPQYVADAKYPLQFPQHRDHMGANVTSLADRLRDQHGYRTWHVGKWHIGGTGNTTYAPVNRGFDRQFIVAGPGLSQGHFGPIKGPSDIFYPDGSSAISDKYHHSSEIMTQVAIDLINDHHAGEPDKPFFLNYWNYVVHSPYEAHVDDIAYFESKLPGADSRHRNPVYASMIRYWDRELGRLVQALKDAGEYDDTLFIFWGDNGGVDWENNSTVHDPGSSPADDITPTILPQYSPGSGVTITDNLPLREGKSTPYEGGVRVPALIHCPANFPSVPRSVDTPVHVVDIFPTILDYAGEGTVSSITGRDSAPQPLDGKSMRPVIENNGTHTGHDIFHYGPQKQEAFVRRGDWKLYRFFVAGHDGNGKIELYNLADDEGEATNLAEARPEIAAPMLEALDAWVASTAEMPPIPNPAYNGTLDDPEYDYLGWMLDRHPLVTGTQVGVDADIEGDGRPNREEFIFDGDPLGFTRPRGRPFIDPGTGAHHIYFTVPVEVTGTAYWLERSDDLAAFQKDPNPPVEVGNGSFGQALFGDSLLYKVANQTLSPGCDRVFYRLGGTVGDGDRQGGTLGGFYQYSHTSGGNEPQLVDAPAANPALPAGGALENPVGDTVTAPDLAAPLSGKSYTLSMDFSWWDLGGNDTNESVHYNFGPASGSQRNVNAIVGWGITLSGNNADKTGTFFLGTGNGTAFTDLYAQNLGTVGDDGPQWYHFSVDINETTGRITGAQFNGTDITGLLASNVIPRLGATRALGIGVTGAGIRSLTDNLSISLEEGSTLISDNFETSTYPQADLNAGLMTPPSLGYKQLLFLDNFNIPDTTDINASLETRQFGPYAPHAYGITGNRSDLVIAKERLDLPLTITLATADFGAGTDSVAGKRYRFDWNVSWDDLNGNETSERIHWTLSGNTGFQNAGASVQAGLDIDAAEFYVGLGNGTSFQKVASVALAGVVQGDPSPGTYTIRLTIDETGPSPTLAVEFQGAEVPLASNVISWRAGANRTFFLRTEGSGIHAYIDDLRLVELD